MTVVEQAQEFIERQDGVNKDEYWETDKERAESVLCKFLQDAGYPVWKVTFVWQEDEDNVRTANYHFVLESSADKYITDNTERYKTAPCGSPTEVKKCVTLPRL